jgi:hypothetical protein
VAHGWLAHEAIAELFDLESDLKKYGPLRRPLRVTSSSNEEAPISYTPATISWPHVRSFVHLWYVVMSARLQDVSELELLAKVLASGLERFPNDPELLLARGSVHETHVSLLLVDRSLSARIYMPDALRGWRYTLYLAESDFADTRRLAPTLTEATLRWGHTRLLAGDEKDAQHAFSIVTNSAAPVWLRYLALLFDGARAEADKQPDQAKRAYERALALIPDAQAPLLSLSAWPTKPATARRHGNGSRDR